MTEINLFITLIYTLYLKIVRHTVHKLCRTVHTLRLHVHPPRWKVTCFLAYIYFKCKQPNHLTGNILISDLAFCSKNCVHSHGIKIT